MTPKSDEIKKSTCLYNLLNKSSNAKRIDDSNFGY